MRSLMHSPGWFLLLIGSSSLVLTQTAGCGPRSGDDATDWGGERGDGDGSPVPGPKGSGGDRPGSDGSGGTGSGGTGSGGTGAAGAGDFGGMAGSFGGSDGELPEGCAPGTFDHDDSAGSACAAWSTCAPGQRVLEDGTADLDRTCEACSPGTFSPDANVPACAICADGTFSPAGAASCTQHKVCTWSQVEEAPGSSTRDTLCGAGSPYRQFGTTESDEAHDVSLAPGGGVYVAGGTWGALADGALGGADSFLRRYDGVGNVIWTRQFGYAEDDAAHRTAVDGDGNVVVLGHAPGGETEGKAYLRKFDEEGETLWHVELTGDEPCLARALASNAAGHLFVAGTTPASSTLGTHDVCVRRYGADGALLWSRSAGSPFEEGVGGIALTPDGRVLVAGSTDGDFGGTSAGGRDVFVWSLDLDGTDLWLRQLGSPADEAAVALTRGALLGGGNGATQIVGWTRGDLMAANAGEEDVFIRALGSDGTELEGTQWGTAGIDVPTDVVDGGSQILVTARTQSGSSSEADGLLLAFRKGSFESIRTTLGTPGHDVVTGITRANQHQVFVVGSTSGALVGENLGGTDAFVGLVTLPPR